MVDRYYNSWIEDTDQVVEEDSSSTMSASRSRASSRPQVPPDLSAAGDREVVDPGRRSADNELSEWNVSTSQNVADDSGDDEDENDDDVDDDDDNDVFRSFM